MIYRLFEKKLEKRKCYQIIKMLLGKRVGNNIQLGKRGTDLIKHLGKSEHDEYMKRIMLMKSTILADGRVKSSPPKN